MWERVPVKFGYPLPLPVQSPRQPEQKVSSLPSCSLLVHVTGPRRQQGHS
ncbi:unnamed protein product [Staurois parvus]|uniref:Uncharacterized protein n=1 Tax=Staurois parvus TaxID=386267 RepID=A0ABN9AU91_9NEOB|nr:unnamed protein product [Staurois parvus]